jgi:hypothetical protein
MGESIGEFRELSGQAGTSGRIQFARFEVRERVQAPR